MNSARLRFVRGRSNALLFPTEHKTLNELYAKNISYLYGEGTGGAGETVHTVVLLRVHITAQFLICVRETLGSSTNKIS